MILSPVDIYSRFCVHSSSTFILFFVSAKIWKELKKITVKHALYWLTKFKHINCLCIMFFKIHIIPNSITVDFNLCVKINGVFG